jgi:hypothetical protein
MTTPENTLEFAIDCMADASNQLSNLDNELLVAVDLDYFDVHQMREALQFIAEGLLRDALQCKSFLDERKAAPEYCSTPSVSTPDWSENISPASTPSCGIHSSDFGDDSSEPAWSYHPSSDSDA